jgi:HD-GYP domain-containing protein (c-di-GMP phosphodiesterase class II)
MKNFTGDEVLAVVSKCALFKDLDPEILKSYLFNPTFETLKIYKKGENIIKQGAEGKSLFVVVDGKVEIERELGSRASRSLCIFGPGDFFGEMALLMEDGQRNASVLAEEEGTACVEISKSFFKDLIENVPKTAAIVLRNISERNKRGTEFMKADLNNSFRSIIHAMGTIAEFRDLETAAHISRVGMYVTILSQRLRGMPGFEMIDDGFVDLIGLSSPIHDVGKVGIPDSVLLKPGKLDPDEWEIMKKHAVYGGEAIQKTLSQFCYPQFLEMGRNIALYHHEKWDGSGYPDGLEGDAIPLEARIMALADIYDALRQKRCYKDPFSHIETRKMIIELANNHLDGRIVKEFASLESTFEIIFEENKEN